VRTPLLALALCALLIGVAHAQKAPSDAAVERNNRGAALLQEGNLEDAIAELREAVETAPAYVVGHANLAYAYERQGRSDEAIAAYQKVVELEPDNSVARNNLGALYSKNARYDDAIREFEELLRRDPTNTTATGNLDNARRNKGVVHERQEQIGRTLTVVDARPNDPRAAYDAARIFAQQGNNEQALAWLTKALDLGFAQLDFVSVDPALLGLRKDPRLTKLLEERRVQTEQPR
jgi:tetratricopeptide (TPR) repeat protein